jgi:hypothetical protein
MTMPERTDTKAAIGSLFKALGPFDTKTSAVAVETVADAYRPRVERYLENDAVISDCGKYRYLLRRVWDYKKPRALFVMLNPSTADASVDDPTIRSCVRLVNGLGYGSMEVVNLYAWRSTDPDALPTPPSMALGCDNPRTIEAAVVRCDTVICAWGAHPYAQRNVPGVLDIIRLNRPAAYCFGKTKAGAPKHPLYIKSGTPLSVYQ